MNRLVRGIVSGTVGILGPDVASYLDMAVRGRSSGELPAEAAGTLVEDAGIALGHDGQAENRSSALGALLATPPVWPWPASTRWCGRKVGGTLQVSVTNTVGVVPTQS